MKALRQINSQIFKAILSFAVSLANEKHETIIASSIIPAYLNTTIFEGEEKKLQCKGGRKPECPK